MCCLADRHFAPIHEDLPLPTHPPYTAFVGNLAFDITEKDLEDFFQSEVPNSFCVFISWLFMVLPDQISQNHQGSRGQTKRLRLCRVH